MKIKDLKGAEYNPRVITDEQLERLKKALHEFGDLSGIIKNIRTGNLVGGHQRIKIIPADAIIEITEKYKKPSRTGTVAHGFIVVDGEKYIYREVDWDETKEKAANIAANQHGGEFDNEKLSLLLKELKETDIDIDLLGFDNSEFNQLLSLATNDGLTDPDDVPEVTEAITKTGDLWLCGNHRLLCGDATKKEDVERLMDGKKANICITSPPYWLGKPYEKEKTKKEIELFQKNICKNLNFSICDRQSRIILNTGTYWKSRFMDGGKPEFGLLLDEWINEFSKNGWLLRHVRIWSKRGKLPHTNPITDMIDTHWEFIATFYNPKYKWRGQIKCGESWAQQGIWDGINGTKSESGHCAAFPIEIPQRNIILYSLTNEIILDPFLGSGSTMIAAEKTNRICYGMEIDPHYCDIIIKRWENFTGKKAERKI